MGTLKIYTKPDDFTLSSRYERLAVGDNTGNQYPNYSYCRRIESEIPGYTKYQIGVYINRREDITYPEENRVATRQVIIPRYNDYYVYIPENGEIFFCVGAEIEGLEEPLLSHSQRANLYAVPFDLLAVERAQSNGRVRCKGQTCVIENGGLKITQRRIDGHTFNQNDNNIRRGSGVEQKSFELTIAYQNKQKSFYIYPDGKLTTKGRNESGTTEFDLLRRAYDLILRATRN